MGEPTQLCLVGHAEASREAYWTDLDATWSTLTRLQQAIVRRVVDEADAFRPFDAAALADHRDALGRPVDTPEVQTALEQLRHAQILVRLDRGRYVTDDVSLPEWHAARFPSASADSSGR